MNAASPASGLIDALLAAAQEQPDQIAMHCPDKHGRHSIQLSYGELETQSRALAHGLLARGLKQGDRCAVMVPPTPDFFIIMFALFRSGIMPVLIDPGIEKKALKACLSEADPHAFIGIRLALFARKLLGWAPNAKHIIRAGDTGWRHWFPADDTVHQLIEQNTATQTELPRADSDAEAAILFTSGSTGIPKGVVYRHRHFEGQINLMRQAFNMQAGSVDMPTFPPFALFDPALGMTSVIPDMNPTRPAQADPNKLLTTIKQFNVAQMFGSPALMARLVAHGEKLPHLRRVTSAGAPVPPHTVRAMLDLLDDDAQFWTPYGATECLPVAVIEGRELLTTAAATESGHGTCVGTPVPPNEVRIIAIQDGAIASWQDADPLPRGQVGEITVFGPTTTERYYGRDEATRKGKINETLADGGTRIVHRMGDVGYFDEQGRLWFCGRMKERIELAEHTLFTEQVEPIFNAHPNVFRTALVACPSTPHPLPVLCVECLPNTPAEHHERIEAELLNMAQRHEHTRSIGTFVFHPSLPVDIRHNAKIRREKLTAWALKQPSVQQALKEPR